MFSGDESRLKGAPYETGVTSKRSSLAPRSPLEATGGLTVPKIPGHANRGVVRISLPPSERESVAEQRHQQEVDDVETNREYQLKAQMLEQYRAQNSRVRGLLNRIASGVREYEMCQSGLMNYLDLPYNGLPQDLLEAFSHDPAAVTGSTRRLKSWKAVDDIHARLARQRAVFEDFLTNDNGEGGFPVTDDVLREPILALMSSLDQLEAHRREIAFKAKEVSDLLKDTQKIHNQVKTEYNETLAHTSVVYPELSQITALEESYRDQYQHVWEIGMDALTFILDTVTPFWRTYGKTIGYDVQDFLIVPLYRNEFTGEAKRYPITRLPRRSFRHWMGLLLFFCLCMTVTLLQARAAVSSSLHYRLDWIEYGGIRWTALPIFWIAIFAQWIAVVIESAIVLLQIATVCWWFGWAVKLFH
ncbi:membrane protein [Moniliophthora roreri MCA 2997]|uniref:Membrane protein n=1 Tax=Moniliophthora roreri (strain MCA 2997) TaxID=1381753 RepID=V2XZ72_MONRO|nr:membrane protein [Moniliophthora roreri MCA 2997]